MARPSHFLLLFTAVFLTVLWLSSWGDPGTGENGAAGRSGRPWNPERVPAEVVGRVLDHLGWPVQDARVMVRDAQTQTDPEGRFQVAVMGPAAVELEVTAPDHAVRWERVHPAAGEPLVLVLNDRLPWVTEARNPEPAPPATMLAGVGFVEDQAGEPVGGALVTVRETGACVRTDEVGRYTIPLPHGTATLVAHDPTGLVADAEPYTPPDRQGLTPLPDMVMLPGATLSGLLRDPDGGPRPGAALVLEGGGIRRRTEAGEDGLFRFPGLVDGDYQLRALPLEGFLGFEVPVRMAGDDLDLQDLALVAEQPLRIQIVGERGDPEANAHVVADESGLRTTHAQADELGWVLLRGLAGEGLRFEVRSAGDFRLLPVVRRDGDRLIVADD